MSTQGRLTQIAIGILIAAAGAGLITGCSRHAAVTAGVGSPAGAQSAVNTEAGAAPAATPAPAGVATSGPAAPPADSNPDLVFLAGSAFDGCARPPQPNVPPSGAIATKAQMVSSQSAAKAFDAATNVYLACVDQAGKDFTRRYARVMTVGKLRQVQDLQNRVHNGAVDTDQAVADRFNRQLRAYKARGSSS